MSYITKQPTNVVKDILKGVEDLNQLKDVNTILDRVLFEVRKLTSADAGSIFLIRENELTFSYVHNDTLFDQSDVNKAVYAEYSLPLNNESIVGHVACTGETLVLNDAYEIPAHFQYSFNKSFDKKTGYRTHSMLVLPLKTFKGDIVGVMQLINSKSPTGEIQPFNDRDLEYAPLFAAHASVAIERGIMTRELILRMMKMAEMRDPLETGNHVMRVGAYCAEIFHHMMLKQGMEQFEIRRKKDLLRLAAMLHDVGKVGISDAILKKNDKLDDKEFATMRWHSVYGAALFANSTSELDLLCHDIALHHHQKWDGSGYPGDVGEHLDAVQEINQKPLQGEEIPLVARICAVADVYDALCSKRCYKEPWPEEKVETVIKEERGKHFDPAVVDAFFEIKDTIMAIRGRWD